MKFDQSVEIFGEYKKELENFICKDLNESETRSKVIDFLLKDVLGWTENDISREGKLESGFFDYKVSCPGFSFIIEAKRTFKEFKFPNGQKKIKIKSILDENADIFNQIRGYATDSGIQYGILTNGKQFIFCKLFNIDGTNWKDNSCLIFDDINDVSGRFVDFYENLSKSSIIRNGAFKYDLQNEKLVSKTIISTLIDREKEIDRNNLSSKLSPIIDSFFGEIFTSHQDSSNEEFIKECFIENIETKKNRDEIERLFQDKAPAISNVVKIINTKNIVNNLGDEILEDNIQIQNPNPPKPIIIIGSKGAGKTTFINHLFNVRYEDFKNSHMPIYIDFREFFGNEEHFDSENLCRYIIEKIYENYDDLALYSIKVLKRVYFKELRQNNEGIWAYLKDENNGEYEKKVSEFIEVEKKNNTRYLELLNLYLIRERRKRLVVIIDNADQYSDAIQGQIFLFSQSLSKSSLSGVIISLREGYYYKWKDKTPFDAYESNVYHITAPKYSEVLLKRIDYTLKHLNTIEGKSKAPTPIGYLEISNQSVIEFLSGLKDSIFSEHNTELIDYLNYTTYPNIREGLRVFKQFLTSGHTDVSTYIIREQFKDDRRANKQIIPIHEFIKSLGLQNKLYFNSEISIIKNLFIPPRESVDHFLMIYLLKYFSNILIQHGANNKFSPYKDCISAFLNLGYRNISLNDAIEKLIKMNLLETDNVISDIDKLNISEEDNLAISSKGFYYLNNLINTFTYLDLTLQDTPIYGEENFNALKGLFPLSDSKGYRDLRSRKETVIEFLKYLEKFEYRQPQSVKITFPDIFLNIKDGVSQSIDRINQFLNKNVS